MPDWEPEIKGRRVTKMACHLDTFTSKPLEVSKSIYDANFLNITLRRSSSREKMSDNVPDADTLFFPVFYATPSGKISFYMISIRENERRSKGEWISF